MIHTNSNLRTGLPIVPSELADALGRPMRSLRVSVTDRCDLRCRYCMPEETYAWIERKHLLTFEEIMRLAGAFVSLGVDRLRLTGGEPLLRRELPRLIEMLRGLAGVEDLALTTNGTRLAPIVRELRTAGLDRVTVSLDTLRADRFGGLAGRNELTTVLAGIEAASGVFEDLKINTVVMRGVNDDELIDLIEFGQRHRAEVRFIEYMDVGGATEWTNSKVVSRAEILDRLVDRFGDFEALRGRDSAPAERFALADGTTFGIIGSTTSPFCGSCDRSRLTADGMWFRCLYSRDGSDLKSVLRDGGTDEDVRSVISTVWKRRLDRGAEERVTLSGRGPFAPASELRENQHWEMHTRGG